MSLIKNDEETADKLVSELIGVEQYALVLYNDDVNTFEHVIYCLIKYCNHTPEQAEQCANIIHSKGKYAVKSGPVSKLLPIFVALERNKLSCKIE